MKKNGCCFSLRYIRLFPYLRLFPKDDFTLSWKMQYTNGRREKFPAESQYFFKPEKEDRRSY